MQREQKACWQHGSATGGSDNPPQIALFWNFVFQARGVQYTPRELQRQHDVKHVSVYAREGT